MLFDGMWPSGKAPGFGPGIRGFESLHPSQIRTFLELVARLGVFFAHKGKQDNQTFLS